MTHTSIPSSLRILIFSVIAAAMFFLPTASNASLTFVPPPTVPLTPELVMVSNGQEISDLTIGQDLDVKLLGGSANTAYRVILLDEYQEKIVSHSVITDGNGDASIPSFWIETGILGCDPWSNPDPADYLFRDLLEAETHLDGRHFEMIVTVGAPDDVLTAEALELHADNSELVAYLSDDVACRRHIFFAHQSWYMSFVHLQPPFQLAWIFIVPHQDQWQIDDPLEDESDNGADYITIPPYGEPFTVDLGQVFTPGYYDVILRLEDNQNPTFRPGDLVIEPEVSLMDSKTYQPCKGIHCKPPADGGG